LGQSHMCGHPVL